MEEQDLGLVEDVPGEEVPMEETPKTPEGENPPLKEDKSKELSSALAQKEHWRKKYEEATKGKKPDDLDVSKEYAKIYAKHDEIDADFIIEEAKLRGIPATEAEKIEHIQLAIEARKKKVQEQTKTPAPSSSNLGSFENQISKDTPPEEADKILQERFRRAQEEGTGI